MSSYPGFEVFSEGAQDSNILKEVIRLNLNKELGGASLDCVTSLIIGDKYTDTRHSEGHHPSL
jgi:hypothetical protein